MHHVVSNLHADIGQRLGDLLLDKSWDHACNVHGNHLVELIATFIRCCRHVGHQVIRNDILTNPGLSLRHLSLVTLTGVDHDFLACGLVFVVVEASDDASIADHQRHFHLQMVDSTLLIVLQTS